VAEPGSDLVRTEMQATEGWYICRIGFVETVRAVGLAAGPGATQAVRQVDQHLVEHAARLTLDDDLRSLDALHLTAALLLSFDEKSEDIHTPNEPRLLKRCLLRRRLARPYVGPGTKVNKDISVTARSASV